MSKTRLAHLTRLYHGRAVGRLRRIAMSLKKRRGRSWGDGQMGRWGIREAIKVLRRNYIDMYN
jgi:hypothetical protein